MKFIVGKSNTGKTKELIEYSLSSNIPIFALHNGKANSLRVKAFSYFNKAVQVVTPDDLIYGDYHGKILVDDLEKAFSMLLAEYLKTDDFEVVGATVTEED